MNHNKKFFSFFLVIVILIIIIKVNLLLDYNNNNNNNNSYNNHNKIDTLSKNVLMNIGNRIQYTYSRTRVDKNNYNDADNVNDIFPIATTTVGKRLKHDVYDSYNGKLLLSSQRKEYRIFPNTDEIPKTCGFGRLYFSRETLEWRCKCINPDYFSGIYCDEPQDLLTKQNKCLTVANIDDISNRDISTFNPILKGVCVECSTSNAIPIFDSRIPKCGILNDDNDDEEKSFLKGKSHCFADPLNPRRYNSPLNQYIPGYGCACDYYNGFVEVQLENNSSSDEISHACIKMGDRITEYHRAHLAYYTLQNTRKPIQIHEYTRLEPPFKKVFKKI